MYALNWPRNKCKIAQPAILVFEIKNNKNIFDGKEGKQFDGYTKDWTTAVNYFMNKEDREITGIDKQTADTLESYEYIFGPIPNDRKAEAHPKYKNYQLCLKELKLAGAFYNNSSNIREVIFFK